MRYLAMPWSGMAALAFFLTSSCAHAQQEEELKSKLSGSIEAGALAYKVTDDLGDWRGEFIRAVINTGSNVWNADLLDIRQFGERTQVAALAMTHTINEDWYASGAVAASTEGNTQARTKVDTSLSRKWMEQRNLVTTVGFGATEARDGHRDHSLLLDAAYYFESPWVLEGGFRLNRSNPGAVLSRSKFASITYGREKQNVFNVRYGSGSEAYQSISSETLLTNFDSKVLTLTWRTWIATNLAFQTRGELYQNPYYDRRGLELSVIKEF